MTIEINAMTDPKLTHDGEYSSDIPAVSTATTIEYKQKTSPPNKGIGCLQQFGLGCLTLLIIPGLIYGFILVRFEINKATGNLACIHHISREDRFYLQTWQTVVSLDATHTADNVKVFKNKTNQQFYVFDDKGKRLCYLEASYYGSPDGETYALNTSLDVEDILSPGTRRTHLNWFYFVDVDTGSLTVAPGGLSRPIAWSPDSKKLAYWENYDNDDPGHAFAVLDVDTMETFKVATGWGHYNHLYWSDNNTVHALDNFSYNDKYNLGVDCTDYSEWLHVAVTADGIDARSEISDGKIMDLRVLQTDRVTYQFCSDADTRRHSCEANLDLTDLTCHPMEP
jgi:hypothetical protein